MLPRPAFAVLLALFPLALAAQQQPVLVEQIDVRVIEVDVVVYDREGRPVPDLTRDDFALYEDGRRVEITNFSRVVDGQLAGTEDPAATPQAAETAAPKAGLTWAVFLDQTDMSPSRRNFAIRELREFLETGIASGDRGIVAGYDGLTFRVRQTVTGDKRRLLEAVAGLRDLPVQRGPVYVQGTQLRAEIQNATEPEEASLLAARIGWTIEQETNRTKNAIINLRSFIDLIGQQEGRVAVVYVGAGFNTLPGLSLYEAFRNRFPNYADEVTPSPQEQQFLLDREITRLLERLSATRATFYAIHEAERFGTMHAEHSGTLDVEGGIEGSLAELRQEASARELADRTGGLVFRSNPELSKQLAAVTRDLKHYYSLGYRPAGAPGTRRDLRVEVKLEGARVRHREAARERSPEEQAVDSVVAALFDPVTSNPLGIAVEKGKTRTVRLGMAKQQALSVKVPLAGLTFIPQGETQRAAISLHFAMASGDGTVWRMASRELPIDVPEASFADARAQHFSYNVEVPLLSDSLRLAVSVYDQLGAVRSVVVLPLGR